MESGLNAPQPIVMCREIHKNGILKKYNAEKKTGFVRKSERVWTVFCLHDDAEAFLEFYSDQKMALNHKPDSFVSLNNAHHITQSICASSDECEFVVTLPTQVIRLASPSWDMTMEWVETIRNKLRELRVLAPKENVYSKIPEPRPGLLPTRDPTSPLPLPPVGPRILMPGVESPVRQTASSLSPLELSSQNMPNVVQDASQPSVSAEPEPQDVRVLEEDLGLISLSLGSKTTAFDAPNSESNGHGGVNVHNGEASSSTQATSPVDCRRNYASSGSSVIVVTGEEGSAQERIQIPQSSDRQPHHNIPLALPSTSNVTVIEVPPPQSPHYEQLFIPSALRSQDVPVSDPRTKLERVASSGLIPRVPSRPKREVVCESRVAKEKCKSANASDSDAKHVSSPPAETRQHKSIVRVNSLKDCSSQTSVVRLKPGSSTSVVSVVQEASVSSPSSSNDIVPPLNVAIQPVPSSLDVKDIPLIGGHQRRRRRSSSSDASQAAGPQRSLAGADLIRVAPSEVHDPSPTTPLTLREAQVFQLRKEMIHPGGVRLKLRCKDSVNSIALVDILNSVWVAGWKQREHPLLCNALHIGDEVLSVGEVGVKTAAEAHKLLKGSSAAVTELVVRRLPKGRVLMLQRSRREASVGLVPDVGVPGEVRVEPEGVASRAGLPLCATAMDCLTLTPWAITEINGRPLNLFCKVSDINTRLDAVGKEMSVLVQPSDFIQELRKQLKNVRSYKDYLLQ